jgi:uncharacterized protein (DUF58 family)
MHNKKLMVGLLIFSLLITALITRNGDVAWMILPFLTYLGIGIWQSPSKENIHLQAERRVDFIHSHEGSVVVMHLIIQNQSLQTIYLTINDFLKEGTRIIDGTLSQKAELHSSETLKLDYSFTAIRGKFSWESIPVIVSDPLNLIITEINLPASAAIQINPKIKKFKAILFRPHSTLHSPGSIPARLGGSGTDFFGIREYHPGDPLRSLDWRLTARYPRKIFTKEFEQEEIAEISLILDIQNQIDHRKGQDCLVESSISATASLAEMFLHQGHRVSLFVCGASISNVFPGYGKVQLQRIINCLAKVQPAIENRKSTNLNYLPIRMFPSRAMIITISSLTTTDKSFFLRLRAFGYQALLISPNPIEITLENLPRENPIYFAVRATRLERALKLREISRLQIPVIDWQINQPLYPLVRNALARSRGQREY